MYLCWLYNTQIRSEKALLHQGRTQKTYRGGGIRNLWKLRMTPLRLQKWNTIWKEINFLAIFFLFNPSQIPFYLFFLLGVGSKLPYPPLDTPPCSTTEYRGNFDNKCEKYSAFTVLFPPLTKFTWLQAPSSQTNKNNKNKIVAKNLN